MPSDFDNNNELFSLFTRNAFEELANYRGLYCISIYIPCEKSTVGNISISKKIKDKCLYQINRQLTILGLKDAAIRHHIGEVENIFRRLSEVRIQGKGLAIYIGKYFAKCFNLPVHFELICFVNDHFYLQPVTQLFNPNCQYMLLYINQRQARLFFVKDNQLHRTLIIKNGFGPKNIEAFFEEVDKKLCRIIQDDQLTLVLAGSEKTITNYTPFNNYKNYQGQTLITAGGAQEYWSLRKKVWKFSRAFSKAKLKQSITRYKMEASVSNVTSDINEIVVSATSGLINTLFIEKGNDVYGEFDIENNYVLTGSNDCSTSSLSNIAATQTILNNGNVYLMDHDSMPNPNEPMNAILTYQNNNGHA